MHLRIGLVSKIAVSLIVIVSLLHFVDVRVVLDRLGQAQPIFLISIFAIVFVQYVLVALRWALVAKFCKAGIGPTHAVRITIISMFFNQTLPGMLGGDFVRVFLSVEGGIAVRQAFLGVAADRILALFVLIGLTAASLPVLVAWAVAPRLIFGMAGLAGILTLSIFVFLALPMVVPTSWHRWRVVRVLIELSKLSSDLFRNRRLLTLAVPLAIVVHLLSGTLVVLCASAMKIGVSPVFALILTLPMLLAMSVPVSISGWGVREGAMVIALGQIGVSASDALAVSIGFGIAYALAGIPGGALWLTTGRRPVPATLTRENEIA